MASETTVIGQAAWRRLDAPGHDACRLLRVPGGYRLAGLAVGVEDGQAIALRYATDLDQRWRATAGLVTGWRGNEDVTLTITRLIDGRWTVNGRHVPEADDCVDLDYGFTPATNLAVLRRLALDIGTAADAPAAWLDVATGTLQVLPQRYERRSEHDYWYESPSGPYSATLRVDATGFCVDYPGLWESEPNLTPAA